MGSAGGGLIQLVVSSHSPGPPSKARQSADFTRARAGISSLQLSLSATWTGAAARRYTLNQVADWMCRMPARLAGLCRKGAIEPGYDADLVIFDSDAELRSRRGCYTTGTRARLTSGADCAA